MDDKFMLYERVLRVPEFFLFDPLEEYLDPPLRGYRLQEGRYRAAVIVIDIVTERAANLHAELVQVLGRADALAWQSTSGLYAVAYRTARTEGVGRIDA